MVVCAPKDLVVQMRKMVDQLDRPGSEAAVGKNIDMTLTLLRCSTGAAAKVAGFPLPADMESVARQLRAATPYKDVELWDVVPMRLQQGTNFGIDTSGDFREGQKTVVGKVSGTGEEDAIFVVITLKVLEWEVT